MGTPRRPGWLQGSSWEGTGAVQPNHGLWQGAEPQHGTARALCSGGITQEQRWERGPPAACLSLGCQVLLVLR